MHDGWHVGFWPDSAKCCIVLTHDVESTKGFDRMETMADLEERYGFRSAWNLPLAQYPIDWQRVERLRARGFEFGAHGLCHDGRLFRSHRDFAELAPILERLAAEHDLRGFRAPSTLRDPRAIATMDFDFDSSFADTDPYEPQPGGTCSLFPFHLSRLIELPYTLPQDHTLIHLLRRSPLPVWTMKAKWIASLGGMILTLTHPDYCGDGVYLKAYEELLKRLGEIDGGVARAAVRGGRMVEAAGTATAQGRKRPAEHNRSRGRACDRAAAERTTPGELGARRGLSLLKIISQQKSEQVQKPKGDHVCGPARLNGQNGTYSDPFSNIPRRSKDRAGKIRPWTCSSELVIEHNLSALFVGSFRPRLAQIGKISLS